MSGRNSISSSAIALLLGGSVFCCCSFARAEGLDKAQAVQKALAITGLGDDKQVQACAVEETLKEADQPPSVKLTGHAVWRVSLTNVAITVRDPAKPGRFQKPWHREDGGKVRKHPTIDSLDVLIDKATGKLISISSPPVSGYSSAVSEEEALKARSERYVGLPDAEPQVNLLEALQSTYEGLCDTLEAKHIEASYVLFQTDVDETSPCHKAPCPVWAIVLTGVSSVGGIPVGPDGKPMGELPPYMNMRHLVDATTGDWLGASNIP